jgi:hypothetical protein
MEISNVLNYFVDPGFNAPQLETKPLKAPDCEQDVQRFEAILSGEGSFQPKSIDLLMPPVEPNAIETMSHTLLNKVSNLKQNVDTRFGRVRARLESAEDLELADVLRLQYEVSMFSIESSLIAKSGDKAAEGIKTLFRNQ